MQIKNKFVALMLLAALSVVALAGCQPSSTTPANNGGSSSNGSSSPSNSSGSSSSSNAEVKLVDGAKDVNKLGMPGSMVVNYTMSGDLDDVCGKQVKLAMDAGYKTDADMGEPLKVAGVSYQQVLMRDKTALTLMCGKDSTSGAISVNMTEGAAE